VLARIHGCSIFAEAKDKYFLDGQFSDDGKYLLSNGEYMAEDSNRHWVSIVQLWDVHTGKRIPIFDAAKSPPISGTLLPDGKHVLAKDETRTTFSIWDIARRQELRQFSVGKTTDEAAKVDYFRVSPDGESLLTNTRDGYVDLWDIQSGRKLRRFC
jgi:WD40 repeat protein